MAGKSVAPALARCCERCCSNDSSVLFGPEPIPSRRGVQPGAPIASGIHKLRGARRAKQFLFAHGALLPRRRNCEWHPRGHASLPHSLHERLRPHEVRVNLGHVSSSLRTPARSFDGWRTRDDSWSALLSAAFCPQDFGFQELREKSECAGRLIARLVHLQSPATSLVLLHLCLHTHGKPRDGLCLPPI